MLPSYPTIFQAEAAMPHSACSESTGLPAHREGQRHVVSAPHQLLPVPLDLLFLSQLLVVLNQLVNLELRRGTDTSERRTNITPAAIFQCQQAGVPANCFIPFLVPVYHRIYIKDAAVP